jgi:ribosomal protein S18 acetylase RimI-like enzyme
LRTSINTRLLRRADLPALEKILEETGLFPPALLKDMAQPFLSDMAPHIWLVAETDCVLGFAYAEPERMTEGTYNLLAIAVRPHCQGSGVGKSLVASLVQALRRAAGRILLVETSSLAEYAATRAFYSGQGFTREARIRDFYQDGEDKIVFWTRL